MESGLAPGKDKDSINRMKRTVYRDAASVNRYKKSKPGNSKGLAGLLKTDVGKLESIARHDDFAIALALATWATTEFRERIIDLDTLMAGLIE